MAVVNNRGNKLRVVLAAWVLVSPWHAYGGCGVGGLLKAFKGRFGEAPTEITVGVEPPTYLRDLFRPEQWDRISGERKIHIQFAYAAGGDGQQFLFQSAMTVRATPEAAKAVILDFNEYPKLSSCIKSADFEPETGKLQIAAGLLGMKMAAEASIKVVRDAEGAKAGWVKSQITSGKLSGLEGEFLFQSVGNGETALVFRGQTAELPKLPPKLLMESCVKPVLEQIAEKMRIKVESVRK